jgi:hypothetical protein
MTDAPSPDLVLRRSAGDRVGILAMAAIIAAGAIVPVIAAAVIAETSAGAAVFFLFVAACLGLVLVPVWIEALGRHRTLVHVKDGEVRLRMPARRGFVPLPPIDTSIPMSDLRAIETRVESFASAGTTVLQRSYALVLSSGRRVVLGGDRRMIDPYWGTVAGALAAAASIPITDLGTVDGAPGFLMLWGQTVPDWDAKPLAPEAAASRVAQERRGWRLVWAVLGLLFLARLIAAILG